jgi:hypothetical protein
VTPFSANGLVSGTNTLVFTVGNGPGGTSGGASGLDFVATVAPTPPKQPDCATVSGNLLSSGNCGFELPSIGATNIQTYTPTSPPAGFVWTVAGTGMEIDGNGRLQSNSGLQSIDLNPNGPGGEVYQDIPTTAGDLYSLSFAMSGNPGCTSPVVKTVAVTLGGSTQSFSFDTTGNTKQPPPGMGWTSESFGTVTAAGSTTRLDFASTTTTSSFLPSIDDVIVLDVTPTPRRPAPLQPPPLQRRPSRRPRPKR